MKTRSVKPPRRPGIDIARGLAVLGMILFHFSWDWNFEVARLSHLPAWYWEIVPDIVGGTFFFVAGMSQVLSPKDPFREGGKIFGWGMALTGASFVYSPGGPIVFGVLHSIGLSKILSRPITHPYSDRVPRSSPYSMIAVIVPLAIAALAAGFWLRTLGFASHWSYVVMWLGFRPSPIPAMADYYPLLPDIGYMWLGIAAALAFYRSPAALRAQAARPLPTNTSAPSALARPLVWTGRHALVIYFVHQPILFGTAALIGKLHAR